MKISNLSSVDPGAQIGKNVEIGPFCTVGPEVIIGDNTRLMSHVCVQGPSEIGKNNVIYPFASIGLAPQDLKWQGEKTGLKIGDNNTIREYVTMNQAQGEGEKTIVGSDNLFMAYTHIAHNCVVGNSTIFANAATLAGHVHVHDFAVIGGLVGVHQFVSIGKYAMIGGASKIVQDIGPYLLADGNPAEIRGINSTGLKRRGFSSEERGVIKNIYKIYFRKNLTSNQALAEIEIEYSNKNKLVNDFVAFIKNSSRGILR
jgi:UDP-N-acetylglucosamine acyltransferase